MADLMETTSTSTLSNKDEEGSDAELKRLYRKVSDHYVEIVERRHSAVHWSQCFRESVERKDFDTVRMLRCIVQDQTKAVCRKLFFSLPDKRKVDIAKNKDEIVRQAIDTKYFDDSVSLLKPDAIATSNKKYQMTTRVFAGDCIDAAVELVKKYGLNPLVLNMASATTPGGGYKNGAGAQEENLFRRTNLLSTLADVDHLDKKRKWHYPLAEFGGMNFLSNDDEAGYSQIMSCVLSFNFLRGLQSESTCLSRIGSRWLSIL